jgi:hypothetical protein
MEQYAFVFEIEFRHGTSLAPIHKYIAIWKDLRVALRACR